MSGRYLLLFVSLLSIFNVADAVAPTPAPAAPAAPASTAAPAVQRQKPFYLIPVNSPDGKTTDTGECIGVLITLQHVLAPAACMKANGKAPTGVFIDFRDQKTYPEDKNLFPISDFTFSKNIQYKDKLAIITLHIPFTAGNVLKIAPVSIKKADTPLPPVGYLRGQKSVDPTEKSTPGGTASIDADTNLIGFSLAPAPLDCVWIKTIAKDANCA